MQSQQSIRKYMLIWLAFLVLDIAFVGHAVWRRFYEVDKNAVAITGHIAWSADTGSRRSAFYTYSYNGQSYVGRGRAFPPNLPVRYLNNGEAVAVTLDARNPGQSVMGDSRVALRAADRFLIVSALFGPAIGVLLVYLFDRWLARKTGSGFGAPPGRAQILQPNH